MSIPDYETVMLPLLKLSGDGKEHSRRETVNILAKNFNLTDQEISELLPSGTQAVFYNRVGWATTYLKKAGLLVSTKRPFFRITPRGLEVLKQAPSTIDYKYLETFPEFVEFRKPAPRTIPEGQPAVALPPIVQATKQQTPEEALEYGYQEIRKNLANDLREQLKNCDPSFFEKLVVQLLVAMGYGGSIRDAGQAIGQTGDGGIDGVIKQDPLGLDVVYVQAKRWQGTVGQPDIQQFAGALQGKHANKGVYITTSTFSNPALSYAANIASKLILIDGSQLAQLMIDYEIGTSKPTLYKVSKIDLGFFSDE